MMQRIGKFWFLFAVVLMVVAGMSFFGVRPKGYRPANNATWKQNSPGLSFDRFGLAYADPAGFQDSKMLDFSIVLAVCPLFSERPNFLFLVGVHDGDDGRQLVVGQWQQWIIAMNGDDYNNRRKLGRIGVELGNSDSGALLVITSGAQGSRFYLNGSLAKHDPNLRLTWPTGDSGSRLTVGNSIYGHHPFRGEIKGLALFSRPLTEETISDLHAAWLASSNFGFLEHYEGLTRLYPMMEGAGITAFDWSENGIDLAVPARMRILKKEVLVPVGHAVRNIQNVGDFLLDVALNLVGFIPLGFLMAMLLDRTSRFRRFYWQGASLFCFGMSLTFETVQIWMPSRYSHLLDLLLNTAGGAVGVGTYAWCRCTAWILAADRDC